MKPKGLKKILFGLGFDAKDGHTRITSGKNFHLLGGSEETHELMQEKAMKFNEHLDRRKKTLDSLAPEEFHDIADKVGLKALK